MSMMHQETDMKPMAHTGNMALVTGAFGEIGRAVCTELVSRGRFVCRISRRHVAGRRTEPAGAGLIMDVGADLADAAGWDLVMESVGASGGQIHSFIHCAGALTPGEFASATYDDLRKTVDDNLMSLMLGCRAVLPGMLRSGRGRIVVLGSLGGIVPMPHVSAYSAVKFGVRGFSLSLAEELKGTGVQVSLLSCGPVRTGMLLRESAHRGSIGFVNRPLDPMTVAKAMMNILEHPRRETMLPRSAGWISAFTGAHARIFRMLYPLASAIGEARKRRYRNSEGVSADIQGSRP